MESPTLGLRQGDLVVATVLQHSPGLLTGKGMKFQKKWKGSWASREKEAQLSLPPHPGTDKKPMAPLMNSFICSGKDEMSL